MTFLWGFVVGAVVSPFLAMTFRWLFVKTDEALETDDK